MLSVLSGPYVRHKCTDAGEESCGSSSPDECIAGAQLVSGRLAKVYEIEAPVIRAIGLSTICPRDGLIGSSYTDAVDQSDVARSTCMLSYTWVRGPGGRLHAG